MRLCFSVIFSSVIFLSVGGMLSEGVTPPEYTSPDLSALPSPFEELIREATREGLVRSLCREFSLAEEDISVSLDEAPRPQLVSRGVTVILRGEAAFADYRAIEDYLYKGGYESVRIRLSLDS